MARLLRHGRASRVDGRPLALRHARPSAAGHRGVDGGAHDRRGRRAGERAPRPACTHRQRRDDPVDRPLPTARIDRPQPAGRLRRTRPSLPFLSTAARPSRACTATGRAQQRTTRAAGRGSTDRTPRGRRRGSGATGVARLARPRPHRVLGWPTLHARAGDARRRGAAHRVDGTPPTARAFSPARASPSPTGGSGQGSSPASTPTRRA